MRRVGTGILLALIVRVSIGYLHVPNGADAVSLPAPATQPTLVVYSPAQPAAHALPVANAPAQIVAWKGHDGFWRIGQDQHGVWWFVSPSGDREFLNTVTTVQPTEPSRAKDSPGYVSHDWDGTPGGLSTWAAATWKRMQSIGFKGIGAWSNAEFHKLDVPMTQDLNVWASTDAASRFYDPQWTAMARQDIDTVAKPLRDNHNLVGYYIDNELDWGDGFCGPAVYFDHRAPDDPNRQQVMSVVQSLWPDVQSFNQDWQTKVSDFAELAKWNALPREPDHAYSRLATAWLSRLAGDYFQKTTELIRAVDPNHLILGVRFRGFAPREVVRASRDWVDAQSLNYYVSDALLDPEMFRMIHDESNEPIIISEFSFHSLDGRSGDRDTAGFAAQVPDQQARAEGYHLFTTRLARVPYIIGADWFQWCDEPPGGRSDGEDVNFGIVDVDDRAYTMLCDSVRTTTPQLDPLHDQSSTDADAGVWRDSFASRPIMHVPFLAKPPILNGELSDWFPPSKLPGVHHSQTIGLERSQEPLPNVYLGWTRQGLYMGLEVFDQDIIGGPAKGWWWTHDYAEFWLSTRPVASDENRYDSYCQQFFFVPNSFPDADGVTGVVGQWHRDGDAIKDNLIPHPLIQDAVRVLPDRYVVEMFIPAAAMHGYDPIGQPALAFNIHVRNFQHAQDYFWSAPKEVMTQERPSTWGTLYLQPPTDADRTLEQTAQTMATPAVIPAAQPFRQ